jgi:hypothetical protein
VTNSDGLTLSEASAATGKHRQTLVRALSQGKFPGARKAGPSHAPVWRIPVGDLEAAGYEVRAPEPEQAAATPGTALAPIAGDLVVLIQETTNAQRDAAEARAALEVERERHRHALERATSRTSRPEVAVLGALGTGGYAAALALDALDPAAVTAIPAALAVALALYAAYAAYRK